MAAFVLFFFPIASHLMFPTSHYLRHYRIPIPWTVTVLSLSSLAPGIECIQALVGSNGITRLGDPESVFSSSMSFFSRTDVETFGYNPQRLAPQALRRDFQARDLTLSCWQYQTIR